MTSAAPAFAGPPPATVILAVNDLPTVISNLTTWVTGIIAAIATLFLTIGGTRYLMAGGDPSEVERAKGSLKSAGIGYALALLAPIILTILNTALGVG
ncbi:MAG: pilin [Dactylosporangium sp.]|nr:pilin [Dactylosporangium sp.]